MIAALRVSRFTRRNGVDAVLLACVALVLLGAALAVLQHSPVATVEHIPVLCVVRRVFGVPCPGCGITRALVSLGAGDWAAAWRFHPGAYVLMAWVALRVGLPAAARQRFASSRWGTTTVPALLITALLVRWCVVLASA